MTSSTTPAAARKLFDQAMTLLDTDAAAAEARFREATEIDPSMADAWLGRIAAGDESLSTVQQLYTYGARLHRETNRLGARLSAPIKAGPYLSISVTEASHAGLALASALIDDRQYEKAEALLEDSSLLDTWENHQWQQYIEAYLMFATQRWPDVISVAAAVLPPQAIIMSAVTAATCTLAAHAAAHLGQARVALEWTDRVELRTGYGGPTESRRQHLETAFTAIDPNDFPLIAADLAYVRGMAHRQLGEEHKAQIWLSKATINGALIESAKQALADPALQLVVTDEDAISSRTEQMGCDHRAVASSSGAKRNTKSGAANSCRRGARCSTTKSGWPKSNGRSPNWRTRSRSERCAWPPGCRWPIRPTTCCWWDRPAPARPRPPRRWARSTPAWASCAIPRSSRSSEPTSAGNTSARRAPRPTN